MSKITRRDFINGSLMLGAASMLPFGGLTQALFERLNPLNYPPDPLYYPPALTGLRGSHIGSYNDAHTKAWGNRSDWGPITELGEEYISFLLKVISMITI